MTYPVCDPSHHVETAPSWGNGSVRKEPAYSSSGTWICSHINLAISLLRRCYCQWQTGTSAPCWRYTYSRVGYTVVLYRRSITYYEKHSVVVWALRAVVEEAAFLRCISSDMKVILLEEGNQGRSAITLDSARKMALSIIAAGRGTARRIPKASYWTECYTVLIEWVTVNVTSSFGLNPSLTSQYEFSH